MDLKDLKSAWDTYSSQEVDKHRLEKETIHEMLKTRTKSLVDRIDRNIRIGMTVLLVFIAYVVIDSLFLSEYFSKLIINEVVEYPQWLVSFDFFSTTLIITTYLFFAIRYLKIKRSFSIDLQLKNLLKGIVETVQTYRRMFYLAVVILLLNMAANFVAGYYEGLKIIAASSSVSVSNLSTLQIWKLVGIGILYLAPVIIVPYFFLRWGFNKLYGRYLQSLNDTLKELDESEVTE
jgi:hypothetical protein